MLVKLSDDVRLAIDKRMLVFFDFTKAFDSVCHATFLNKLSWYSISTPVLTWLESYITGRY